MKKDTLERIKNNIKNSMDENSGNINRFNESRELIFKSTLSLENRDALRALEKPIISFNMSESFLSQLRGEFAKNEPAVTVFLQDNINDDPEKVVKAKMIEGHIKYIFDKARREGVQLSIFDELSSGGFSVAKVYADYKQGRTFKKEIKFEKAYNSTLTGFDLLSRHIGRGDSCYCFEIMQYEKDRFEKEFNKKIENIIFSNSGTGFSWFFRINNVEIITVADYYEFKDVKETIILTSDNKEMLEDEYDDYLKSFKEQFPIEEPPVIVEKRTHIRKKVKKYRLSGDSILDEQEGDEDVLPLVEFQANSVVLSNKNGKTEILHRPYLYNTVGTQKLADNLLITIADECQNIGRMKTAISEESISPNYEEHITNPQKFDTMVYRQYYQNDPSKPTNPPFQLQRTAFPPELMSITEWIPTLFQNILGTYNSQLSTNNSQLSGVAVLQSSIHANNTASPIINNYILALNEVARRILHLIPLTYTNEMSLPAIDDEGKMIYHKINNKKGLSMDFDALEYVVKVEAGSGFAAQKQQQLDLIVRMAQAMPLFGEFINTMGLSFIMDNLEIEGVDKMKEAAKVFMQQKQQQQQQQMQMQMQQASNNPLLMKEKNKQIELQITEKQNETKANIDAAKLHIQMRDQDIKEAELQLKTQVEGAYINMEQSKVDASKERASIEMATNVSKQIASIADHHRDHDRADLEVMHNHQHNNNELQHKIADTILTHTLHERSESQKQESMEH